MVSSAVAVLAVSLAVAMVSYGWDWWDAIDEGGIPEPDEWLGMAGAACLPLAAVAIVRLVRLQQVLARRAQEAAAAFEDTVHTAHGWVWQADTGLRITYASDAVHALLGHQGEHLVGHNLLEVVSDDPTAAAVDPADWHDQVTRTRHHDGSTRYLSSTVAPMRDHTGTVVGYRGFTSDVTAETISSLEQDERRRTAEQTRIRIQRAIQNPDSLQVMLQPIAEVQGQQVAGMEALARFTEEPYRPPNEWFAEAWEVGLGPDLELRAVELAYSRLAELPPHAYLSVNVSAQTLLDDRFLDTLLGLGADTHRVVVEVTEHALIEDYDALADVLHRIRALGARLAVDDAGAGYASMQHILRLRPDIIKLDRSIVADSNVDPARFALIGAMASFGTSLGMTVVAEGVETAGEFAALAENRVSHAQGYYLARPSAEPVLDLTTEPATRAA
ncbi:EAL domain-containing protein [Actinoplanes sp. NBC_00393]|uniref:sensor domain-containing phosphodiesterase n=1 Tax=Actinoplanes sp. NBC_00393 TaxID=2975953 RepID=UPI002E222E4C